ncbi:uncharacterized protein C8A04DRAFT_39847 [Dichotomopilus funicola]|uniref:Uncharacterized protein n=1 Tax=Dichotomopilus funicola TaxID=1934379 RepID=A0AAN6ZK23_9PEZI|nr:hypothetical protein C8A04DRAFT_39847 [Dichotomopilus funicola]
MARIHKHPDYHQSPLLTRSSTPDHGINHRNHQKDGDGLFAARELVDKWQLAASHLSHITAGRLTLGLVCDIDPSHPQALEATSLITTPLRLLPQLRDCQIRLGNAPDPGLQRIAGEAALHVCRLSLPRYESAAVQLPLPHSTSQLCFMALPRELRICILECTDLVAPGREVTWSRQDQRYVMHRFHGKVLSDNLHLRPFVQCWEQPDDTVRPNGCFCRRYHASFTQLCRCWAPPGPTLFLICRTWCQDAQFIFFTRNRFVVHDYLDHPSWAAPYLPLTKPEVDVETDAVELREPLDQANEPGIPSGSTTTVGSCDYPYRRLAASQFLRDVVPVHCLIYLRFVELVFPPYLASTWPQDQHPAIQDWRATIDWLRDRINGAALTIRLVTVKRGVFSPDVYHKVISRSDADHIHDAQMTLVRSLKPLATSGVSRVYIRLSFPWDMTPNLFGRNNHYLQIMQWAKKRNAEAEQSVLRVKFQELYSKSKEPTESYWWHRYHGLY